MKSFKDYIKSNSKAYKYTVKIACDEITSEQEACLEEALKKVDLVSKEEMFKSPLQENPLDFPNIKNCTVNVMDFTIQYPSTSDVLERIVSETLGVQRCCVIVYTENDPRRVYTQQYLDRKAPEFKKKYKPALGSMYEDEKPEKIELYGKPYNDKLLAHLAKEKKARKDNIVVNALSPKSTTDSVGYTGEDMPEPGTTSPISGKKTKE